MMKAGLLQEVKSLLPLRQLNALQAVGYREFFDYFDGEISLDDAVNLVKIGSKVIGGKGGGGRADFAQAGGSIVEKIDDSFEKIKSLIN